MSTFFAAYKMALSQPPTSNTSSGRPSGTPESLPADWSAIHREALRLGFRHVVRRVSEFTEDQVKSALERRQTEWSPGLYWCARDLSYLPIGNHHFLLCISEPDSLPIEQEQEKGVHFVTLGGFTVGGKLLFRSNDPTDVKSVREGINPEVHTSPFMPDFDIECHRIFPPEGMTNQELLKQTIEAALHYLNNEENAPSYNALTLNCSMWCNTLLKVVGIPKDVRDEAGDFYGLDFAEDETLDENLFRA